MARPLLKKDRLAAAFLLGMLAAVPVLGVRLASSRSLGRGTVIAYTRIYTGRYIDSPLSTTVVVGDAQAFAAIAQDPALRRPGGFYTDDIAAYRAQRPLLGYLTWALSLGQPRWVEPSLLLMAVVGAGLLAMGVGLLLEDRGLDARLGALLVFTPGVVASTTGLVPEPLGCALVLIGLWAFSRDRLVAAVVLFTLAALTRETMLLVPAVLALGAMRRCRWDRLVGLGLVFAGWGAWVSVVKLRYHAWPWDGGPGRLTIPFVGFVRSLPDMRWPIVTLGCAAVAVALAVLCLLKVRQDRLAPIVLAFAAFGTVLGAPLWHRWDGFGRIFVPIYVLGGIVAITEIARLRRAAPVPPEAAPPLAAVGAEPNSAT